MNPLQEHNQSTAFNFSGENTVGESATHERDRLTYFIMPVLIVFVVLGLLGNLIILGAVCAAKRFNRPENLLLASLATASVVIMIATVSLYIQMEYPFNFYGPMYCKFFPVIHTFMVPAEGFTMMCISLERTQTVRFPLMRTTKVSTIKKIAIVWYLALFLDLPRGWFYIYDPHMNSLLKCRNTKEIFGTWIPYFIYVAANYVLTFILPSLWLARDWIHLVSKLRFLIACQTLPLQSKYRERQKKLVRHAIIFTSIFIAVKLPVGTHLFMYQLPRELISENVIEWVKAWKQFFFTIGLLHGCFYPFIIFALSRDIRKFICCCEFCRQGPAIAQ